MRKDGRPVRLGSRALELLASLIEHPAQLVPYDALIARGWPDTVVAEANLRVQISALRRALAHGFDSDEQIIVAVPGRGYRFVAPVAALREGAPAGPVQGQGNLPAPLARLFGRSGDVLVLKERLERDRLVTIVGAGGIGKTTVALAVAREFDAAQCWFIDLSSLADAAVVPATIAATLGVPVEAGDTMAALTNHLRNRDAILILDNCEHVIHKCAEIAEALLLAAPYLRILATSREPLKALGECVVRLHPLAVPSDDAPETLAAVLSYSAVQLFVERAGARAGGLVLRDADALVLAEICRELEGMPLALELAAANVATLGLREVAQQLKTHPVLLNRNLRTATPRQATLTATLEWSYRLLSEIDRLVLRRLAVLSGRFSLRDAIAVAGIPELGLLESLTSLAEKSLVHVDLGHDQVRYRLLQLTRAYVVSKMDPDEVAAAQMRRARHIIDVARELEKDWSFAQGSRFIPLYAELIDDARAALNWSLSPEGDFCLGVDLTVEALPIWYRLSLIDDYRDRVSAFLSRVRAEPVVNRVSEMRLLGVYGIANFYSSAAPIETSQTWKSLHELAAMLNDVSHQMLALWGRWVMTVYAGALRQAKTAADRFAALAEGGTNVADQAMASLMRAQCALYAGDLAVARDFADRALGLFSQPLTQWGIGRTQFDPVIYLMGCRAKISWLQGKFAQAAHEARAGMAEARRRGHAMSQSFAAVDFGVPVALLNGDADEAAMLIAEHRHKAEEYVVEGSTLQSNLGMRAALRAVRGEVGGAAQVFLDAITLGPTNEFVVRSPMLVGVLTQALGEAGEPPRAMGAIALMLATLAADPAYWCRPELLRVHAILAGDEAGLVGALDAARIGGLPGWELRIACDLAALWGRQGRRAAADGLLRETIAKIAPGESNADLRRAAALLAS